MDSGSRGVPGIDYRFVRPELLEEAFTHKSWRNEHPETGIDNERLEFLGDAVLDLVVADYLYATHPGLPEGELSRMRAAVVSEQALAPVARALGLGGLVRLGRGEELSGGREKKSILANTFEAVVGALYLDGGFSAVREVALQLLEDSLEQAPETPDIVDAKSRLQEMVQASSGELPSYVLIQVSGPDHDPRYEVAVSVAGAVLGTGSGRSKKKAEQRAATEAILLLKAG